jgi:hypothetical protein
MKREESLTRTRTYKFLDLAIEVSEQEDSFLLEIKNPSGGVTKELVNDISDILFYLEYHVGQRYEVNLAKEIALSSNLKPGKMYQ